jgi:hydrogenase nickel incorporation protein HypA/HybF
MIQFFFTHTDIDTVFLMHELGVTQNILQIALEHAQKAGAGKIHRIHLVIGGLSGVVHESVQFYFDFVSKDTLAEGAQLVFKRVPARFRCRKCAEEFEFQGENWNCPACQAPGPDIISGREFYLESLEVE